MKVLMVGATGKYAGIVLPELTKRGVTVRALVKEQEKQWEALEGGAAEVVIGDLRDAASLRPAADGVEGVFHINPAFAPHEEELGLAMVRAARDAGVRRFVFSGVLHPSISSMTNHAAKQPVEEAIYTSGMEFTVLQPAMFFQTLEMGWKEVVERRSLSVPYSKEKKACYVDYRDVAEVAALAFTSDRLAYGTFELCASGMVSRVELAELMSRALGRKIEAEEPSFAEWVKDRILEGPLRDGLSRMYAHYDAYGFPGGNSLVLEAILGRKPRTLEQFLRELAEREASKERKAS